MASTRTRCWRALAAAAAVTSAALGMTACGPKADPPARPAGPSAAPPPADARAPGLRITGSVQDITRPPRPGSVPYRDAIIAVHLTGVTATGGDVPGEIIVYTWGMRDNRLTPAASTAKGTRVSVALRPWEDVEEEHGSVNRIELTDPDALALTAYWADRL